MPRYDYNCSGCGDQFEMKQSFQDPPTVACPSCGAESGRVIRAPLVVYKGSGFTSTEKRNSGFGSYWNRRAEQEDQVGYSPDKDVLVD